MTRFAPPAVEDTTLTVLGDEIYWVDQLGCPVQTVETKGSDTRGNDSSLSSLLHSWKRGDDQLRRCRKQKRLEAKLLLTLPRGACYLDVGAHFGDSVVTMAAHAQSRGRDDLKFFALEPSAVKCQWIRRVVQANKLNHMVKVMQVAVGDKNDQLVAPPVFRNSKVQKRCLLNGSLGYVVVQNDATNNQSNETNVTETNDALSGMVKMVTLDSYASEMSPVGILHLDVEGWEPQALCGAFEILKASTRPSYIIAEAWDDRQCQKRGMEKDAAGRIHRVMEEFNRTVPVRNAFHQGRDVMDCERNVFYFKK